MTQSQRETRPLIEPGALLSALADPVVVVDEAGTVVWANAMALQSFGPESEVGSPVGARALELVHPEDRELVALAFESMREKERGTPIEVRLRTASGWRLTEIIGSNRLQDPEIRGTVLNIRDLTERRRWEVASDETSRFRALVHNAPAILMLLDRDLRVVSVSAAVTRILGHDQERVEGRALDDLVAERDRQRLAEKLANIVENPRSQPETIEVDLQRHDPEGSVPFELAMVDLLDDPTVDGLVVWGHDISRLRASLAELEEAHSRLVRQERLSALGEMASMIGHELRNPLNAVLNALYLLRDDLGELASEPEQLLSMAESQTAHAVRLAEQVTSYMRQRDPELAPVNVRAVLDEVIDATPPPDDVELAVTVPELWVTADAGQLAQILTNLVNNAYEAIPEGGVVEVSGRAGDGWSEFSVDDTGPGVDPEVAGRLFEPFVSAKLSGTGLGLAIVGRLVEAHHGEIAFEDRRGGGTRVRVRLPAAAAIPREG
jgi:PAS domain S-box-containing protein